uniref:NADP-dependent oxidoreductase domain-containing protein n=1 Tax=Sus scrofa TaxID=9823 RepID=A0A4X1T449_PIG
MALSRCVKLNDGHLMPVLGLGTLVSEGIPKSKAGEATRVAIEVGYRHIDAAYVYENEEEVGSALREKIADGTVKREELFYTTKLWATFFRPELVRPALERSLKKLRLDYVDLFIIHVPITMKPGEELLPKDASGKVIFDTVDLRDTWAALEKCKDAGLTKSIGVSNFNHKQLEMILNKPGLKYKPVCNQVECHPYLNQSKLLEFCRSHDILLVAYATLGSDARKKWVIKNKPSLLQDPVLNAIAEKHRRTPAQVALRYQLQRGVVALAKSFSEQRIKENFQVFEFELTPEDMESLDGLNRNMCYLQDLPQAAPGRVASHPETVGRMEGRGEAQLTSHVSRKSVLLATIMPLRSTALFPSEANLKAPSQQEKKNQKTKISKRKRIERYKNKPQCIKKRERKTGTKCITLSATVLSRWYLHDLFFLSYISVTSKFRG